ncbi:MAG TPA: hypothetical protein VK762_24490 [Polyangiaceae bacterium]|jgi:hypothetical protein|nr:hypothetical protein [Polyangiaceae bacterium]
MRSRAAIRECLPAALLLATACIDRGPGYGNSYGNVNVYGTASEAHVLPPIGYDCYPHYLARDGGYVYDVNGHYYKEHDGDWSVLRDAPSLVRYQTPEVSSDRRCLEYPP